MKQPPPPVLHVLRGLYRLLKTPPLSEELAAKKAKQVATSSVVVVIDSQQRSPISRLRSNASTAFLIQQYRASMHLLTPPPREDSISASSQSGSTAKATNAPDTIEQLRQMAYDCYMLQSDLVARAQLYAMDAGADQILTPHETSRRAAARAGLQLPELYDSHNDSSMNHPK